MLVLVSERCWCRSGVGVGALCICVVVSVREGGSAATLVLVLPKMFAWNSVSSVEWVARIDRPQLNQFGSTQTCCFHCARSLRPASSRSFRSFAETNRLLRCWFIFARGATPSSKLRSQEIFVSFNLERRRLKN